MVVLCRGNAIFGERRSVHNFRGRDGDNFAPMYFDSLASKASILQLVPETLTSLPLFRGPENINLSIVGRNIIS